MSFHDHAMLCFFVCALVCFVFFFQYPGTKENQKNCCDTTQTMKQQFFRLKKLCSIQSKSIDFLQQNSSKRSHFASFQTISKRNVSQKAETKMNTFVPRGLSEEEKEFLEENGYLCIRNFAPSNVALNLRSRMMQLLNDFDEAQTKSVFSSHRTSKQYKDTYFLNSGNKICYFWEENVFNENGTLNREKQFAINKVGHALHTLDPYFKSFIYGFLPKLTFEVGFKNPIALQSMYICKQPGVGGEVLKHQDTTFLFTKPHSCHGFWLAIDETDIKNGCVVVAPGSHKTAKLRNRFKRISNEETPMIPLIDDGLFDDFAKEGTVFVLLLLFFFGLILYMFCVLIILECK